MLLIASAALALQSAQPNSVEQVPSPAPCASEEHTAFDMWVGEWDVYPNQEDAEKVGESKIERVSGGCAIRETWMPANGGTGTSLSLVNHRTGVWEQLWIGSDGTRVDFSGGPKDGAMVLTGFWENIGGPGSDALVRMTYTRQDDGSVRQLGEASIDRGKSWRPVFDFIYRSKENSSTED